MIYLFALMAVFAGMYMFYLYKTDPTEYYWRIQLMQHQMKGGAIVFVVVVVLSLLLQYVK